MDFSDSIEQACDINMLLDYYLGNPPQHHNHVSDKEAAASWHRLAFAARGQLGAGWTTTDVEQRFTPKRPDASQYNAQDVEECDACYEHSDLCPYHQGVVAGLGVLRRAVETMVDYPETLHETLDYADGQRRQPQAGMSAPHRIVIDEDCPNCGWAERWYMPETGVFGCNKCPWRGSTRTT